MTALAFALGWLGALAFVAFVVWLRAQRPVRTDAEMKVAKERMAELGAQLMVVQDTLSSHSLALGLGPRRTPEKRV